MVVDGLHTLTMAALFDSGWDDVVSAAVGALATALLIIVGARVRFHLPSPAAQPVTGQTFGASLAPFFFGRGPATTGAALYVALALFAPPVLAGGRRGVSGASLGYIVGFVACAFLSAPPSSEAAGAPFAREVAATRQSGASGVFAIVLLGSALGQLAAAVTGAAWLAARGAGARNAISHGLRPFVPGLIVKAVLVALTITTASIAMGR